MPALKVFTGETRSTFLPVAAIDTFPGGKGSRDQGSVYVVAYSKTSAAELLTAANVRFSASSLRLATGQNYEALLAANELEAAGTVVAESFQGGHLARFLPTANVWTPLGKVVDRVLVSQARADELATALATVETELAGAETGVSHELGTVLAAAQAQLDTLRALLAR